MRSYRFARRSFLAGVGGALGLKVLLRNLEAVAQGGSSPPRFLLTHWPVGSLRSRFLPSGSGATYLPSPITQPFEDAGLRNDMTLFYGFSDAHLKCPGGGGHEAGTPFTTTCCNAAGTRQNGGENDDGVAGGPSFDQVFLKNVTALQRPGVGYANAICDARVDSNETGPQCLSYGYITRSIAAAAPSSLDGGPVQITENTPLLPQLSPAQLYASLFSNFIPGGSNQQNQEAALKALRMRKSVLDFALSELNELKRLAPGAEAPKIEAHAEAIRKVENELATRLESGNLSTDAACASLAKPSDSLKGQTGNARYSVNTDIDDSGVHEQVAIAHSEILLAAFQCDLIRVATFQFSPGTNHVSFKGMWPNDPERIAMHHPASHAGPGWNLEPPADGAIRERYEFLCNVQTWYNQKLASILNRFKATKDAFGGSLLDYTVIPFITEVSEGEHSRTPKPAFLFGGSKLGLKHGTFQNFTEPRPQVDLYLTAAQALFGTSDVMSKLGAERFVQSNPTGAVIDGLWQSPA